LVEAAVELYIFARFHARTGEEAAVADAIRKVIPPSREEPGCLSLNAFRSTRDPGLFYITPVCHIRFNFSSWYKP